MSNFDLIVGGTGMLAGVTIALSQSGRGVSVVSRGRVQIPGISSARNPPRLLTLDYGHHEQLATTMQAEVLANGPYQRTISWVHGSQEDAVTKIVAASTTDVFVHVMGSSALDPSNPGRILRWQEFFRAQFPRIDYRVCVLGFKHIAGGTRWLQHIEICEGVLRVLESPDPVQIIGTVEPWSARP